MYIKVRVITKAKEDKIEEISGDTFKVWTKMPAEQNLANEAVLRMVKNHFPQYNGDVRMVSGHHSPSKILSVGR
jgi:uncharacterized protein YggU (UPF0235/DUF167 family)